MSWEFNGQKLTEMDRIIEDSHRFYSKYCEKCKFEWECNKTVLQSAESTFQNKNPHFLHINSCGYKATYKYIWYPIDVGNGICTKCNLYVINDNGFCPNCHALTKMRWGKKKVRNI